MPLPTQRTVTGTLTNPVTGLPATGSVVFDTYPTKGATNLSDTSQAIFVRPSKFDRP
jgi:hypothetical protein